MFLAMKWSIEHFQTYLLGHHFKVRTDNNPLAYFLTSPSMDAMKQRWINELVKYDFFLQYQKGKNNTVADALSRISEEHLSDEEAEEVLEAVPMIPMSLEAMKAVFDNLTSGASRRAEQEYNTDSAIHCEAHSHQGECEISDVKYSNACHQLG